MSTVPRCCLLTIEAPLHSRVDVTLTLITQWPQSCRLCIRELPACFRWSPTLRKRWRRTATRRHRAAARDAASSREKSSGEYSLCKSLCYTAADELWRLKTRVVWWLVLKTDYAEFPHECLTDLAQYLFIQKPQ